MGIISWFIEQHKASITIITIIVYDTQITTFTWGYKPTYKTEGAPSCRELTCQVGKFARRIRKLSGDYSENYHSWGHKATSTT